MVGEVDRLVLVNILVSLVVKEQDNHHGGWEGGGGWNEREPFYSLHYDHQNSEVLYGSCTETLNKHTVTRIASSELRS